jgi:hypothetical protein
MIDMTDVIDIGCLLDLDCEVYVVVVWECGKEEEDKNCLQALSGKPVIICLNRNLRQRWGG